MTEFLLVVISALLAVQTGIGGWVVLRVWNHEGRLSSVETEARLCQRHFKVGGSE